MCLLLAVEKNLLRKAIVWQHLGCVGCNLNCMESIAGGERFDDEDGDHLVLYKVQCFIERYHVQHSK